MLFVGDDCAEDHHDVELVDDQGRILARRRLPEELVGVASEVALITVLNAQIERLGKAVAEHFGRHRDADIYTSRPGLGVILGARILGEFGDDPHRYTDAKSRKAYAGTVPITRASGTSRVVLARYARNRRLGDALHQWAFCSMRGSAGVASRARGPSELL